jgi:PleD family two-component response regulator
VLLPNTLRDGAEHAIERLRAQLAIAMQAGGWAVTCSIGVAIFPRTLGSASEMIAVADRLMYEVKQSGKSGVRYATSQPEIPS